MGRGLILLTGGTGFVGYATLIQALRVGYQVRVALRQESSVAEMKATKSIKPYLSSVAFVIIEDITVDGAFDEAVIGVDYIVHVASPAPQPSDDDEATIVQPAIRGTTGILYSALKERSVKRVVITSSLAAIAPTEAWGPGFDEVLTPQGRVPDRSGPYENYAMAYAAAKVAAFNRTADFVANESPKFDVINVLPTFVIGKNELATSKETIAQARGSNARALAPLLGIQNPAGAPSVTVHIDDVAYVHIAALDPKIKGNQNFGVNWNGIEGINWDDAIDIVRKHFPKEVESGLFPLGGSQASNLIKFDTARTEEVFGIKFRSFEEQIVSLAGWYAEVAGKGATD